MARYGKIFMSHKGRAIRYDYLDDGTIYYMVATGNGTDKYFIDWKDAMEYINKMKG